MSGDYSRQRFNAGKNYSGVYMQQGRVQLDADWNEWVDVLDRRWRAETVDILGVRLKPGIEGVAVVSALTRDAFKIGWNSNGELTIEPGRMYVNGLLAENHGSGAPLFDPVLAELRGSAATPYKGQPHHPNPEDLPNKPYLAYLEVWQREVTQHEQPDLVESAVGVDTTTRLQTVWQVRALGVSSGDTCRTPDQGLKEWSTLTQPSAGRLSTQAGADSQASEPCDIPLGGGYRGAENRTYRVEIHYGGDQAAAKFKWSRDNASVVSRVAVVLSNKKLQLSNPGRDESLSFSNGQWVEAIDDWRELSGMDGNPSKRYGEMRKIKLVDPKDPSVIEFEDALPADLISANPTIEKRNLRVRRWDQADGLIAVQEALDKWYELEKGVQIQLKRKDGGEFRTGDYWVFTARTTGEEKVEKLVEAPPRGVHRHYARLAIVQSSAEPDDCRTVWPPDCGCCTITVAPGEDIQDAIDSLPAEGGCVCLKTGVHNISETIEIHASNITLLGESPGAVVSASNASTLLRITRAESVVIDGVHFEALAYPDKRGGVVLRLEECRGVTIDQCAVDVPLVRDPQLPPRSYLGVGLRDVSDIIISRSKFSFLTAGISVKDSVWVRVSDNIIEGATSGRRPTTPVGETGILVEGGENLGARCQITNNVITDFATAVLLKDEADHSLVEGNYIWRRYSESKPEKIVDPHIFKELQGYMDSRFYAIDVGAANSRVQGNQIYLLSAQCGGIRVSAPHVAVECNTLRSMAETERREGPVPAGIYCLANAKEGAAADDAIVDGNNLQGAQTGIVICGIDNARLSGNRVAGSGEGVCGIVAYDCIGSRIEANSIREVFDGIVLGHGERNSVIGNHVERIPLRYGIVAGCEASLVIAQNTIKSVAAVGIALSEPGGSTTIRDNTLANCGYGSRMYPASSAIMAQASTARLITPSSSDVRIEGCDVTDAGISADGKESARGDVWSIYCWLPACEIIDNRVNYEQLKILDPRKEHRALRLVGPRPVYTSVGAVQPLAQPKAAAAVGKVPQLKGQPFGSALVSGNRFRGFGQSQLIEFYPAVSSGIPTAAFENVTFSNNTCEHLDAIAKDNASVGLWGGRLIVVGNHVKAKKGVNAMSLGGCDKVTLLGNITTGEYIDFGVVIPTQFKEFNVVI